MTLIKNRQSTVLDLIGQIYDAALDGTLWPGLAPEIARNFSSTSAQVHVRDARYGLLTRLASTTNYVGSAIDKHPTYFAARDIWVQRAAAIGMSKVLSSRDMVADDEFERSEFYQDGVRTLGVFYVVGAVFPIGDNELAVLGIHRPREVGNYDERHKMRVGRFLPHLRRALQVRQRLADLPIERGAGLDSLERSGIATLVVSGDGQLLYANGLAEQILHAGDAIGIRGGRLATNDPVVAERLISLTHAAAAAAAGRGNGSGGTVAIPRQERLPLTVLVAPFRPARAGFGASFPASILFLRDPEAPRASLLALQGLFGLTAAEAAVAAALVEGRSVDHVAARAGVSLNTVRTHMKSIFVKTGTSRQAQLVALILSSVAVLMAS